MQNNLITLSWEYSGGNRYEYSGYDAAQIGQLYRLKVLENQVVRVSVEKEGIVVIEWKREEEEE